MRQGIINTWCGKPLPAIVIKSYTVKKLPPSPIRDTLNIGTIKEPVTLSSQARDIMWMGSERPSLKIDAIKSAVSSYTQVSIEDMDGNKRSRRFARARAMVYWIARHHCFVPFTDNRKPISYPLIASACGGKNHTSIMYAVWFCNQPEHKMMPHIQAVLALLK